LQTCAICLLSLARAGQLFPDGFTTRLRKGVNPLPMVDVEGMPIDLRLEITVRVPVHVVSMIMLVDFFITNYNYHFIQTGALSRGILAHVEHLSLVTSTMSHLVHVNNLFMVAVEEMTTDFHQKMTVWHSVLVVSGS